jgi:succinate-semialdehyde dehydrogenase/glutarate-semialdehyde dehydrogenase
MYTELALFIDGAFLSVEGRDSEAVLNPATGQALAQLPHATTADLDHALASAAAAFPAWRRTSAYDRGRILKRTADLIRERKAVIARIMTLEQGKPLAESETEVAYAADVLEWYGEEGRRAYGRIVPSRVPGLTHTVVPEPVGVCLGFTPWNFPALTPARKIGGALAAGCPVILKAAEETPGTAVEIARAFADAGLPPGVLALVFGKPADVSSHLIASPISRKISFTGSTPVGKHLMRLAIDGMKRTTMELGGHGPVLVFDDVDPAATGRLAAAGKYRNAGQVCISPTRFYVQESAYDAFVEGFVETARAVKVGNGLEPGVTMGPLANPRRVEAMERIVADARDRGGKIRVGGARRGNEGFFFDPTVITGLPDDALLMTEEPFGPVAPIVPFRTLDEVLTRANSLPFGLAAYAFTTSAKTAAAVAEGLESGMVGINSFGVSTPETPFGGVKDSGHGSEGGLEGLQAYFNTKLVSASINSP